MAEAFEKRFTGWVAGILGCLLATGAGGIFWMALQQATLSAQLAGLVDTVTEMKARIDSGSADRYTGSAAASDRSAFLSAFTSALQSQASSNADLFKTVSDRVQAISIRQTEFDRSLKELLDFKARAEERMRMEKNP